MESESNRIMLEDTCNVLNLDFVHLKLILPEEIWKLITEKLLSQRPDDFETLANSSPFFRKLLARQTINSHLEKVFPLVACSIWKKEGLELEGLSHPEIFKCREVCSQWNAAVDKLIPEKFQHLGENSTNSLTSIGVTFKYFLAEHNWFTNSLDEDTETTVKRFLRHFEYTHPAAVHSTRNPFIWNDVSVQVAYSSDDTSEDYLRYLEDITLLLSKYGQYINKFSLDIDRDNFLDEGLTLQEWFSLMPNLKVLTFESNCWEDIEPHMNYYQEDYSFQKLDNLETLTIKTLPSPLISQLINRNSQITTLILSNWHVQYNFYMEPLPNLKNIAIDFSTPLIIEQLRSVEWPLETLKISLENDSDNSDFVKLSDLFPVLEYKFGTTLVSLNLITYGDNEDAKAAIYEVCKNGSLYLRNLKKIRLSLSGVLVCLEFLVYMKHKLEEISVCVGYKYPVAPDTDISGTTVQLIGYEDKMLESNIWEIFEKLDKLEVAACWAGMTYGQKRLYSRKDWVLNKKINESQMRNKPE